MNKKWCRPCRLSYFKKLFKYEKQEIYDLIQEMQSKIEKYYDIVFEWIPYSQFNYITEVGKNGPNIIYSALWKDGPLHYDMATKNYIRELDEEVTLKYLYNSQNITNKYDEFLSEV